MQPWGYIFQNKFLGEVQLKKYLKKWEKSGVLFEKTPKNRTFHITWSSIQEWGCISEDTVCLQFYKECKIVKCLERWGKCKSRSPAVRRQKIEFFHTQLISKALLGSFSNAWSWSPSKTGLFFRLFRGFSCIYRAPVMIENYSNLVLTAATLPK